MICRFVYLIPIQSGGLGIEKVALRKCRCMTILDPIGAAMNDNKLQDFITTMVAKRRITFGDVRRLSRDYLPAGIASREEAKILIDLDVMVERTDRAWTDWLVASIVDFALGSEPCIGADEVPAGAWLSSLLSVIDAPTEAARRITRELRREARRARQMPSLPWEDDSVVAHAAVAEESATIALQLAA